MQRLSRTRRIVASSGVAAALVIAAPAAIAAADEGAGGDPGISSPSKTGSGSESGDTGSAEPTAAPTAPDPTTQPDTPATSADEQSPDAGAGGSGSPDDGAAGRPDQSSADEPESDAAGDDTAAPEPTAQPPIASTPTTQPPPTTTPTESGSSGRHRADTATPGRHRADPTSPGRHRADASSTVGGGTRAGGAAETAVPDSGSAGAARHIDEFVGEPGGTAAAAAAIPAAGAGVFYRLVNGPGREGLIFLNQSLVTAGVLSRRSRGDGTDYVGLLGPGERFSLPARTVAELSSGTRLAAADTDDSLLAQAIRVLTARLVWSGIDPQNQYLDPSDFQVLIGDNYRIVDNDGITYTYDADADTITFTNTTDTDVAIIAVDQFNVPHGDGVYVVPAGGSTTIDASGDISGYVMQGQRDSAGRAIIYGMVVVQDDQTLSYNFNPFGGAIRDTADPVADPDDRFWDPSDGLTTGILWPTFATGADGAADGVYYTTDADGLTIHNDSDHDIAVTVFTGGAASNTLPQTDFYIVEAGGTHRIALPEGSYAVTSVQGERDAEGEPRLYGTLVAQGTTTGPAVTETDALPGDGIPSITRRTVDAVKPVEGATVVV
ncbi:hypothetical protein GTV32_20635 [Gordonia sp. SID5947]|uniref:hypothetical protein n=1 Tax=Gordonia sp. SID5947 TaxID=2690315 RepID=UPI00137106D4|nr:hypothetical protein [Gordonia sp. SID5947]MYR08565.1 hypothetical protein [Gordonia sp. SID5947]